MARHALIAATDVAAIGMWDRIFCDNAYQPSWFRYQQKIEERARAGELFFISTGGDGSNSVLVLVDEDLTQEEAVEYARLPQTWGLTITSGFLVVGGREDFARSVRGITARDEDIPLPPGHYRLTLHLPRFSVDDCDAEEQARQIAGLDSGEQRLWRRYQSSCMPGCLLLITAGIAACWHWWWAAMVVALAFIVMAIQNEIYKRLGIDAIAAKVHVDPLKRPQFIFVMTTIIEPIPGGHYDWDAEMPLPA